MSFSSVIDQDLLDLIDSLKKSNNSLNERLDNLEKDQEYIEREIRRNMVII